MEGTLRRQHLLRCPGPGDCRSVPPVLHCLEEACSRGDPERAERERTRQHYDRGSGPADQPRVGCGGGSGDVSTGEGGGCHGRRDR